jgi:molybdopterin converting factor small subunit
MSTLRIPSPLRPYTRGADRIEVASGTVAGALEELIAAHPELKQHLFAEDGGLRAFVNVFVNDENARDLQGVETKIEEGDQLMILPSIAGGAGTLDHRKQI